MKKYFLGKSMLLFYLQYVFVIACSYHTEHCFSQHITFLTGAREAGLANSSVTIQGLWSVFNNPAGTARLQNTEIGFFHQNLFMIEDLSTRGVAGDVPVYKGNLGFSYAYFGTASFNEQKAGFGYAMTLNDKLDIGIFCSYNRLTLPDEIEDLHALSGNLGLIIYPAEHIRLGFHIHNISGTGYWKDSKENQPAFIRTGLSYHNTKFMLIAQCKLSKYEPTILSAGAEILIIPSLAFRLGCSNDEAMRYTLGVGYNANKRISADLAFALHPYLGFSSYVSVNMRLVKRNHENNQSI